MLTWRAAGQEEVLSYSTYSSITLCLIATTDDDLVLASFKNARNSFIPNATSSTSDNYTTQTVATTT